MRNIVEEAAERGRARLRRTREQREGGNEAERVERTLRRRVRNLEDENESLRARLRRAEGR
jgi:hypothetical protein